VLRHKAITRAATQRTTALAGRVVEIILDHSRKYESTIRDMVSSSIDIRDVLHIMNVTGPEEIKMQTLITLIDTLEKDAMGIVSKDPLDATKYIVNMEVVITNLKKKMKHSIAIEKFGKLSGRIVELLERNSFLDQQAIGEMAIIPAREARERLYCLYREKWVDYVEVCKRTDYSPASTFYFWYLDKAKLGKALQESIYESLYKLRLRGVFEIEKDKSTVDITKAPDNAKEAMKIARLAGIINRLDQALLQIDYSLMLLKDF
jgi:hypothetical protein